MLQYVKVDPLSFVLQMHPSDFSRGDEEEQLGAPKKPKRMKSSEEEELVYHPVKLSRNDLYRPPTAEELNHLKEAESLFHCSLLKMQVRGFCSVSLTLNLPGRSDCFCISVLIARPFTDFIKMS